MTNVSDNMNPHLPTGSPELDDDDRLHSDVSCRSCDYNLRGLPVAGRCPECGDAVRRSLRVPKGRFNLCWKRELCTAVALLGAFFTLLIVADDTVMQSTNLSADFVTGGPHTAPAGYAYVLAAAPFLPIVVRMCRRCRGVA